MAENMEKMPMESYFAPPKRVERRQFKNQIESVAANPIMKKLLEAAEGLLIILNENRQIVAMNHDFMKNIGIRDPESVLGLRLGETLQCVHSDELKAGCGTTFHCASCGAAIAMMAAMENDKNEERICALQYRDKGTVREKCLKVSAKPFRTEDGRWILFFARDITREQLLHNLERTFFHDINNILSGISGAGELLAMEKPESHSVKLLNKSLDRLQREIKMQKDLSFRKEDAYQPTVTKTALFEILHETRVLLNNNNLLHSRTLEEHRPETDIFIYTDIMLVSRVLANMILNALEATEEGGKVTFDTTANDSEVSWSVRNPGHIPERVRPRIFQKHFTTKEGDGRGFGTYSMKLFGEKFLKGRVTFTSSKQSGTTFTFTHPVG
ncbi:MAG: HAMP domain-containing histidine kinase [Desulfarculaceae bacterium]|nr:HAMP domain-containing histidine kinase [Desulfarculaceae bacterium]